MNETKQLREERIPQSRKRRAIESSTQKSVVLTPTETEKGPVRQKGKESFGTLRNTIREGHLIEVKWKHETYRQ